MTLRIGILGAARVATYAMIDAAKPVEGVTVAGIAARDGKRARAYADEHGIPLSFEGYEAIIAAPQIDAIYNALPPNLHAQWSIAAVEAGKPVLCEKPFALSVSDAKAMLQAEERTGQLIMEAQHSHYHPVSARMRNVLHSGMLGELQSFSASFVAPLGLPHDDLRNIGAVGGGALWDLGVYPAYWIRSATGEEPVVLSATQRLNDRGADMYTEAQLQLPSGARGTLVCDMEASDFGVWFKAVCTRGSMEVVNPLSPQRMHKFTITQNGESHDEDFTQRPTYVFQLEAFRDAVIKGTPVPTRGEDSLATIQMLDAIRSAAQKR